MDFNGFFDKKQTKADMQKRFGFINLLEYGYQHLKLLNQFDEITIKLNIKIH